MTELNDHSSRDHALLSASSAHRWLNCPPSAVAAEAHPAQDTEFTREGTLAHEVAEIIARERSIPELNLSDDDKKAITQEMLDCAEGYRDYIQEQLKSDDAVVLLEQRVDFSSWVPQGFGTADCIIVQDKTITVIDYKYGQGVAVSAKDNPQMKLYALGAYDLLNDVYEIDRIEWHIYQPRINNVSSDSCTALELLVWANETVRPIAEKAAKGKGNYSAGEWCKFCPHAGKCRQLTKTCTEYVETHSLRVAVPVLAPHEVSEILQMEPLITLWLKRVKDQAMSALLDGGEIPGYKVVEGRGSRVWTDELTVAATLKAAGFSAEDITKTELLSVAQMEKAIGKKKTNDLLTSLIEKRSGAPTIASASDKRPAYDRKVESAKFFE